jgi:penicillin-binding protein 1C
MFPPNGARLELSGDADGENSVPLKVTGGARPFTLFVNGTPVAARGTARGRNTLFFQPKGPGFARLTVLDAKGTSDSVVVRLQ